MAGVKIISSELPPSQISDDVIKDHLLLDELTDVVYIYRDAAIDYVERYTNVTMRDKEVEQIFTLKDADSVYDDEYTFKLRYRSHDDEAIISVHTDDDEVAEADYSFNNYKAINEVTVKAPADTKKIKVRYRATTGCIPPGLISAVLIMIAEYYETRSIIESRRILNIRQVMQPYRIYRE
jgi:hypothetical protein